MNIIRNLPLAITGLILAILSLGKIFADFSSIFFIIGSVLIFLVLLKLVLHFEAFNKELNQLIAKDHYCLWNMDFRNNHPFDNNNPIYKKLHIGKF